MTLAAFTLGLIVAVLGIPGALDHAAAFGRWASSAPMRFVSFMAGVDSVDDRGRPCSGIAATSPGKAGGWAEVHADAPAGPPQDGRRPG